MTFSLNFNSSQEPMTSSEGSSASPRVHSCSECGKSYTKPSLLTQHIRTHTNDRPFKCTVLNCDKAFFRKSHLQAHLLSHGAEKPFQCSICGKGVNTRQHLKRHEITHTKSFKCSEEGCTEEFYKHQSLRHHIYTVHQKTLTCHLCNKAFSRPYRLAQHNQKYHSESPVYQCDHLGCFAHFKTWSALQFHIKTEHPKLKCAICGKGCVGKKGLELHMRVHDEQMTVKLWNCEYCDVGQFAKKVDLIEHYDRFHDGNVPEELLKPLTKEKIQQILSESGAGEDLSRFEEVISSEDEEEEYNDAASKAQSQASINSFNLNLQSSRSIVLLISNNFETRKLECPKKNCDRRFAREYDLKRHLQWHERYMENIEAYLQLLELERDTKRQKVENEKGVEKERESEVTLENDSNNDDDDFNDLIDQEIKRILEKV